MNKKIFLAVLIFLFVLGVVYFIRLGGVSKDAVSSEQSLSGNDIPTSSASSEISDSQLSQHDSQDDCWVAYDGKVYDLTSFLPNHPGSASAIRPYCGTSSQFEEAFVDQHGASKVNMLMRVGTFMGDFDVVGTSS